MAGHESARTTGLTDAMTAWRSTRWRELRIESRVKSPPPRPHGIAVNFLPMLEYCRRSNELLNDWNRTVTRLGKAVNQLAESGVDEFAFRERLHESERARAT